MPQLDTTWYASQLFWLAITFTVLFLVLSKLVLPRLMAAMDAREAAKSASLSAADQFRKDAEHARLQYERAMADARERAKSLFVDAELSINQLSEQANKQMDKTLADRLKEADKNIASQQAELKRHFEQAGAALVADIATRITGNAPALVEAQKAFTDASSRNIHS
jgi:F-type H+-transporting ATPase subunit b